jgi:hypothetical protein
VPRDWLVGANNARAVLCGAGTQGLGDGHAEAFTYGRALGVVATPGPIATVRPVMLTLMGRT